MYMYMKGFIGVSFGNLTTGLTLTWDYGGTDNFDDKLDPKYSFPYPFNNSDLGEHCMYMYNNFKGVQC